MTLSRHWFKANLAEFERGRQLEEFAKLSGLAAMEGVEFDPRPAWGALGCLDASVYGEAREEFAVRVRLVTEVLGRHPDKVGGNEWGTNSVSLDATWEYKAEEVKLFGGRLRPTRTRVQVRALAGKNCKLLGHSAVPSSDPLRLHPECEEALAELEG